MDFILIIIAALAPVVWLLYYVNKKDSVRPEPVEQLVIAFVLGIPSAVLAICGAYLLMFMGFCNEEVHSVLDAVRLSLFGAALPEECAKFFFFWIFVRRNRFFDERMDGIVYACCVSLGFAALENIMYLFQNYESWVSVGITRAIFSVPGHFFFGVLMGYYYSLVQFSKKSSLFNMCMVLVAPIVAHTVFDAILFAMPVVPIVSILLMIAFIYFCNLLRRYAVSRIEVHLEDDNAEFGAVAAEGALPGGENGAVAGLSANGDDALAEDELDDYIVEKYLGGRERSED
ncbi:MAG: PrsW family intramembrane metalloprotease [Bacteroidaceae bacterium]|nr:PrsW family intramembrane metalloprotease [Bacteroidaceae bacterium]